jgi:hypothetical protein
VYAADADFWTGQSSSMYNEHCCSVHSCHGLHGLRCLSVTGVFFTILFTYSGFACLLAGVHAALMHDGYACSLGWTRACVLCSVGR